MPRPKRGGVGRRMIAGSILGALAAACSGDGGNDPPPTDPSEPASAVTVQVRNNQFSRQAVIVSAGGTVTWEWAGQNHNVTPVLSPTFSPASSTQDAPFTHGPITFNQPGTYRYLCTIHGAVVNGQPTGMHGTVEVRSVP